jgi:hypothetical protein
MVRKGLERPPVGSRRSGRRRPGMAPPKGYRPRNSAVYPQTLGAQRERRDRGGFVPTGGTDLHGLPLDTHPHQHVPEVPVAQPEGPRCDAVFHEADALVQPDVPAVVLAHPELDPGDANLPRRVEHRQAHGLADAQAPMRTGDREAERPEVTEALSLARQRAPRRRSGVRRPPGPGGTSSRSAARADRPRTARRAGCGPHRGSRCRGPCRAPRR